MLPIDGTPTPLEFAAHDTWTNKHGTVRQPILGVYTAHNRSATDDRIGDYRATAETLTQLVNAAASQRRRLRAIGGEWSLSSVAAVDGYLLDTRRLAWITGMREEWRSAGSPFANRRLALVQGGTSVKGLNEMLATQNLALQTSGASNGQTIAGAISTGTHGSAYRFGAMQEAVRAIHLIVGGARHVWLERASEPVASSAFVDRLGAVLVRDDSIFDAALVSMGGFGIIHALVLEVRPLYLLKLYRWVRPLDSDLARLMSTLDLRHLPSRPDADRVPYHFELAMNSNRSLDHAEVWLMYDIPMQPYDRRASSLFGAGLDAVALASKVAAALPHELALVTGLIGSEVTLKSDGTHRPIIGTPGEIFSSIFVEPGGMSTEIGVAIEDSPRALDIVRQKIGRDPYHGLIALRFIPKSRALLAFTTFPMTCTIELPGLGTPRTERLFHDVWSALDAAGIAYTLHWGQAGNYSPERIRAMYGHRVDEWKAARAFLMSSAERAVFDNAFLERCGLTDGAAIV
jgi:hypothetical protein